MTTRITVRDRGPLLVVGDVEIVNDRGEVVSCAKRVSLCRCGASRMKPFCDSSHHRVGFEVAPPTSGEVP